MAHRLVVAAFAVAALVVFPFRPLVSLILFGAALAVYMNRRSAFGAGRHRAIIGFISALWCTVFGGVMTLLGLISASVPCDPAPCAGNALLLPGLALLGAGLGLLGLSVVTLLRASLPWATADMMSR